MARKTSFQWKAPQYHHKEKSSDWFWAVGIIAISIAVTAVIFNNVLFGIFIIIAAFTLSMHATRKPQLMDIEISERGVRTGIYFYPYNTLDSFWIETVHFEPRMLIKSKKSLALYTVILLEDMDPHDIREFMLDHLPEEEHREPFLQVILEFLGF